MDVETFEVRKDAQLAREVEFALPREMTQAQVFGSPGTSFAGSSSVGVWLPTSMCIGTEVRTACPSPMPMSR
jgi:hypothetical protein